MKYYFKYKPLSAIQRELGSLTYSDYLMTTEWKSFRDKIVLRDNSKCKKCKREHYIADELDAYRDMTEEEKSKYIENRKKEFLEFEDGQNWIEITGSFPKFGIPMVRKENYSDDKSVILNVHHKYYIKDHKPWEYDSNSLITVCSDCHTKIHETESIKKYENSSMEKFTYYKNCDRCSGTGRLPQYRYVRNGICFSCHGEGINENQSSQFRYIN